MDRKQGLFYVFWILAVSSRPLKIFALPSYRLSMLQAHCQQILFPTVWHAPPTSQDTWRPFSKVFSAVAYYTYIPDCDADIAHKGFLRI